VGWAGGQPYLASPFKGRWHEVPERLPPSLREVAAVRLTEGVLSLWERCLALARRMGIRPLTVYPKRLRLH